MSNEQPLTRVSRSKAQSLGDLKTLHEMWDGATVSGLTSEAFGAVIEIAETADTYIVLRQRGRGGEKMLYKQLRVLIATLKGKST